MILYLGIILYVISLVAFLIGLLFYNRIGKPVVTIITILHLIFLFALVSIFVLKVNDSYSHIPWLLFYVCSGLLISGVLLRRSNNILFRIYMILFPLTFLWFVVQPGKFISFITTLEYNPVNYSLKMNDHYFLEKQNFTLSGDTNVYKVIEKHGLFSKAILRNIELQNIPDSGVLVMHDESQAHLQLFKAQLNVLDSLIIVSKKQNTITKGN
ncbi:MAG TPA: hypothetical protein PKM16_06475 [Bacteroidia bacterium]|nr:hypothetical protein [Bacteroidia bacterium]